eukprot:gene31227-6377_t
MKVIVADGELVIPDEVKLEVKGRAVRCKGPRGTLSKDFKHLAVDMYLYENKAGKKCFKVEAHFSKRKQLACIRTVVSHVRNLITGTTKGFQYKLRCVYAHFPVNINIEQKGALLEIRNFLGEKRVRKVQMLPGVSITRCEVVKDQLIVTGNCIENVSRSSALINQSCLVRGLDIRKFLDGVYVSEKGLATA